MTVNYQPRFQTAIDSFCEFVQRSIGCDREVAESILDVYIRNKLVKFTFAMSRFDVNHGAFLDYDTLKRAEKLVNESGKG